MEELLEEQNEHLKFSVLLSVYHKEKPEFFDKALESIYNQTVRADEWVIVKDGPISDELQRVIDKYKQFEDVVIKEVPLEENKGLGIALSIGVPECRNELIARMDTDDIAVPNRFELQLAEFELNPELDLCGGQIIEFESDENVPVAERRVPLTHEEIVQYQKRRSAFNHMTVMFRKSKVLEAGNYKNCPLMEDDMLWVDMIIAGAECMNLDAYLCRVRTNRDMIARRGGLKYYKKYKNARNQIYRTGFISRWQYIKMNLIQFLVCIMPKWIRRKIFFGLIHKKSDKSMIENAYEKRKNMKALILSGIYWDDTIQRHHQFANYLLDCGYEVVFVEHIVSSKFTLRKLFNRLFSKEVNCDRKNERRDNLRTIDMGFVNPEKGVFGIHNRRKVKKLLNLIGKDFDLILNYLPINTTRYIIEKLNGKVIYDCVRDFSNWGGYRKDICEEENWLLNRADKVFTDSYYLTEKISCKTPKQVIQFLPIANEKWVNGCDKSQIPNGIKNIAYFGTIDTHIDLSVFSTLVQKGYVVHFWGQIPSNLDFDFQYHGYFSNLEELAQDIVSTADAIVLPYKGKMDGVIPAKITQCLFTEKPVYVSKFYDSVKLKDYLYLYDEIDDLLIQIENYSAIDHSKRVENIKIFAGELDERHQYEKFTSAIC